MYDVIMDVPMREAMAISHRYVLTTNDQACIFDGTRFEPGRLLVLFVEKTDGDPMIVGLSSIQSDEFMGHRIYQRRDLTIFDGVMSG